MVHMVHTHYSNMPKKSIIKRCIVYIPDDLYYKLSADVKRHPDRRLRSVSAFFRSCAINRRLIIKDQTP